MNSLDNDLIYVLIFLIWLVRPTMASFNALQCVATAVASPELYRDGWKNAMGDRVTDPLLVVGVSLEVCKQACDGPPRPSWATFSQQFAAWLLPWFALISQLPFGAATRWENLMSMLLTIGSPTLALYSLAFTVINGRYVYRRFKSFNFPNAYDAARILACLQHAPLHISRIPGLLESLVALESNDIWFKEFRKAIEYEQKWGSPAIAFIGWAVVAYIFTVVNSFTVLFPQHIVVPNDSEIGKAIGSLWLWVLPLVVGWLQLGPKSHATRIREAFATANVFAKVAERGDIECDQPALLGDAFYVVEKPSHYGREIHEDPNRTDEHIFSDQGNTSPVFNYSRILPWIEAVEMVAKAFDFARLNAKRQIPVHRGEWHTVEHPASPATSAPLVDSCNRTGTLEQVVDYCTKILPVECDIDSLAPDAVSTSQISSQTLTSASLTSIYPSVDDHDTILLQSGTTLSPMAKHFNPLVVRRDRVSAWRASGLVQNFFVASAIALGVQWGTTGSAVLIAVICSPNSRVSRSRARRVKSNTFSLSFGCRSLGYTLFGAVSTTVWFLMVISSFLAYSTKPLSATRRFIVHLLCNVAKLLASINAVGILTLSLGQFLSLLDNCYCSSSALGRKHPFVSTVIPQFEVTAMIVAWGGAIFMALSAVFGFYFFVSLYIVKGDPEHD
ncbi:hypothetical protein C8J56DRAFT_287348 [Mycena floridula]|nr:hypothetical protein C8J56DRAFT_287348 [Mycena floridula]